MPPLEISTLKSLRRLLLENAGCIKIRRVTPARAEMRKRMDEALLGFRVAQKATRNRATAAEAGSWLRTVRQAVGVPVEVMARRLGVKKYEIFRLEKAEREARIVMATLKRAAGALGCELVYALVPRQGSLEDLAIRERTGLEKARAGAREIEAKRTREIEEQIDWRPAVRRFIRQEFRKHGMRIR